MVPLEPIIELTESVAPALHLDTAIGSEQRYGYIAAEASVRGAGEGHALGGEAVLLQDTNDGAFGPVAFLSRCASAAAHGIRLWSSWGKLTNRKSDLRKTAPPHWRGRRR